VKRLVTVALVTVGLLLTATPSVARVGAPPRFNRTTGLDVSQVNDTRNVRGEVVCAGDATPDDDPWQQCTVNLRPAGVS